MKNNSNKEINSLSLEYRDAFKIMMKSTSDLIYFKDKQSRFIYISDAQLRRFNKTDIKDVIGKTDYDFFSDEHAAEAYKCEQQIIKTETSIIDEEEHTIFANGELSWFKVSRYPLYDQNKNIVGTWGISTDITSQKSAEIQAKEREARYHLLADITIEGIAIHENGIIKDANPSLAKLLGYGQKEIIDKSILNFVSSDDKAMVENSIINDFELPFEITLIKKGGKLLSAEIESKTVKVLGSKLRMVAIRDITKHKQVEHRNAERMKELQAFYNLSNLTEREGITLEEILREFTDILPSSWQYPEITYARIVIGDMDFRTKNFKESIWKQFVPINIKKVQIGILEVGYLEERLEADEGPFLSEERNLITAIGERIGYIVERKQNEEELIKAKITAEEATGAKSEFLANMSHEIRTPMNAVIGFSGLMKKTEITVKQQDYINKIDSSAKSLLGIINDILDFSKMEAGKLELEDVDFRLDDVMNNTMGMIANKAAEKNIELISNIESNVPYSLIGDPLRLGQILINLVNNAVKFTEKGHVLINTELIKIEEKHCQIKFSVTDTGIGLTEEQKKKLFSAFSQADSSVTRRFGGTGLGLTISKRLVEMMNGEISAESEFGEGSTFSFYVDFMMQTGDKKSKIFDTDSLRNIKVLIVDDNEMARDILREQISAFGIEAVAVASGKEAILEVRNESGSKPYDLVIMDWRMPEMDGIEAAKRILGDKKIKHMPMTIMVSAFGREEVVKKAEKIGINTFLMKPINQSLLFDSIMNLFDLEKKDHSFQSDDRDNEESTNNRIDGLKILLVEDNAINQEVATEILSSAGANVEIANNGKEAVEAVKSQSYDIVLMDLQMPIMGGYEATKLIRTDMSNKELPIIAMTAHAMQGVRAECIAAGMNDYVSKPINPNDLFSMIRKWAKPISGEVVAQQDIPIAVVDHKKIDVGLPDSIPGVDIKTGISRLNGNEKLYKKLLVDFGKNYSSSSIDIRKAMEDINLEEAIRYAHTLKGVAGNISANDIHDIAAKLELELSKEAGGNYDRLLNDLDTTLNALSKIVSGLGKEVQLGIAKNRKKPSSQDVKPTLLELAQLVWEDNIDAEITLEELKSICGSRFIKEMTLIAESIENFDFEAAKLPLEKIAEKMNIRLDGKKNE